MIDEEWRRRRERESGRRGPTPDPPAYRQAGKGELGRLLISGSGGRGWEMAGRKKNETG